MSRHHFGLGIRSPKSGANLDTVPIFHGQADTHPCPRHKPGRVLHLVECFASGGFSWTSTAHSLASHRPRAHLTIERDKQTVRLKCVASLSYLVMDDVPRAVPCRMGRPFGIPNKVSPNDVPLLAVGGLES